MNLKRQSQCFYPEFDVPKDLPIDLKSDWIKNQYAYEMGNVLSVLAHDIISYTDLKFPFNIKVSKREDNGTVMILCETDLPMILSEKVNE